VRIGVISDTHIPSTCSEVPAELLYRLKGMDLILHAGDLTEPYVLEKLKSICPVEAVSGNMDSGEVRGLLPTKKILDLEGFKIGLIHGGGHPANIMNFIGEKFEGQSLDCIIYGHTHMPSIDNVEGVLYFNPGSPTDHVFAPYNSFGVMEIDDTIRPKIIRIEE